jgi:hypothetical protein
MILFCGSVFRIGGDRIVFSGHVIIIRGDKDVFVTT